MARAFSGPNSFPLICPRPQTMPSPGVFPDQVIQGAPAPLGCDDHCAEFDEGSFVTEIRDVLPGRAMPGLAALCDTLRAVLVPPHRLAVVHFLEVRAYVVAVEGGIGFRIGRRNVHLFQIDERMPLEYGIALIDAQPLNDAADRRRDDMLHFHGFHDQHLPPDRDLVAWGHLEADDGTLHGRLDGGDAVGQLLPYQCQRRRDAGDAPVARFTVVQNGKRVDLVYLGAGQCPCSRGIAATVRVGDI